MEVVGDGLQPFREEVDPRHEVDVLLGHLVIVLHARIVVKSTPHEVASFAAILASPPVLYCLVD
jgi:hypothetical protein